MNLQNELEEKICRLKNMDFDDEEFIKREQSDDLLFEAYDEPVKTKAIKQGEELLKLCESDNLGIRYLIIGLYTVLEKFDKAEKIYNKYSEASTFMWFPLSIMYYKEGNYRKCKKVLKQLQENNEYLLNYLTGRKKFTKAKVEDIEINGTYLWGSEAEAYFVVKDNKYLLETVPSFIEFIEREI